MLLPPRIGVERADPAVVLRVRLEEEAAERERQEVLVGLDSCRRSQFPRAALRGPKDRP